MADIAQVLWGDFLAPQASSRHVYPHFGFSAANIALQVRELVDTN
jgi:hypothetical protein